VIICDRAKLSALRVESRQFSATATALNLPHLHLAPLLLVTQFEFCRDFQQQKTRIPGLLCGIVCVILRLAVSVEHRLVMNEQADTRRQQLIPALTSVARVKKEIPVKSRLKYILHE